MDIPIDLDWCSCRIQEHFGQPTRILDVQRVPSRLAAVHRLLVKVGDTPRSCYLKRHVESSVATSYAENAAHLSAIAGSLADEADLLPYDVIAFDQAEGVLLTGETPGRPLQDLHRELVASRRGRRSAVEMWRGVGRWLAALHRNNQAPVLSSTRVAELVDYTNQRFTGWAKADPTKRSLADRAAIALRFTARKLEGRPVVTTLCHADVSAGNIMVHGRAVGLIDFDDVRLDMPGLDLSQALWEISEFWRLAAVVPFPGYAKQSAAAFREGYGSSFPAGSDFWLPHLRNLSVILLTVASRREGASPGRLVEELRYRRALAELRRTLAAILPD